MAEICNLHIYYIFYLQYIVLSIISEFKVLKSLNFYMFFTEKNMSLSKRACRTILAVHIF